MARFVKFVGVHGEVAVNPEHVLYAAPLPETGDCWLYFGGKGQAEEGKPAVIVVQVKGGLDEVLEALQAAGGAGSPTGGSAQDDGAPALQPRDGQAATSDAGEPQPRSR